MPTDPQLPATEPTAVFQAVLTITITIIIGLLGPVGPAGPILDNAVTVDHTWESLVRPIWIAKISHPQLFVLRLRAVLTLTMETKI